MQLLAALVADGVFELSDLSKVSLAAVKELDGMGANAVFIHQFSPSASLFFWYSCSISSSSR